MTYHPVWHNISHHLVGLDPNLGGFADTEASQSMEQPDPTTMVFKLWPGITWQQTADVPSRPFTARDVAYTLKRITTNDPRFARRDNFQKIDSVTTPDDSTVVIKLKQACAPQLFYLGSGFNVMVNPDAVEKSGGVIDRVSACSGIGPFTLQSLDKSAGAKLQRYDGYFQKGLPYFDGINIVGFTEPQTALSAFLTGQLHVFGFPVQDEDQVRSIIKGLQIFRPGRLSPGHPVGIGLTFKSPPYNDMRVRQAVSLSIDRQAMLVQALQGKGAHLNSPMPWSMGDWAIPEADLAKIPGYRKDKERDQDVQQARQLLAAAGLKPEDIKTETVVGNLDVYRSYYETALPQLQSLGFKITLKIIDNTAYRNAQLKGDYVWQWVTHAVDPEPDAVLRLFNYTGASRNSNGFSDPEIDKLIDRQAQELDRTKRIAITRDISRRLIDRPNWILTANQKMPLGVWPTVKNFHAALVGATDSQDQTRAWIDPNG